MLYTSRLSHQTVRQVLQKELIDTEEIAALAKATDERLPLQATADQIWIGQLRSEAGLQDVDSSISNFLLETIEDCCLWETKWLNIFYRLPMEKKALLLKPKHQERANARDTVDYNKSLKSAFQACKLKPGTKKEELVLRIYNFMWIPHWRAQPSTTLRVFYTLALPPSPPHIDSYHVLDGVLAAVWKAYWRTIFDDVPFVPANVVVSVNKSLQFFFQSSHFLD
ncbi:hypothetical protein F4703DRAFT_1919415 [Phycomyces blakesleeanus]